MSHATRFHIFGYYLLSVLVLSIFAFRSTSTYLGHPKYYPRFGFVPAKQKGISCEFEAPEEAFMVLERREGALAGKGGIVKFQPEFK